MLSIVVAAGLLAALVLFVENHSSDSTATESPAAALEANREAEILVSQDQAPHVVRLVSGAAPVTALEHAIRAAMARQISYGAISGPLTRSTCTPSRKRATVRRAFRCKAVAADVSYPFLGVVNMRARQITYCKRDPPPVPSQNVPISPRCLA